MDLKALRWRKASAGLTAPLIVALICASLAALYLWQDWSARNARLRDARTETANLARSLAQHAQQSLELVDTMLIEMREHFENDGSGPLAVARMERHMRNLASHQRDIHGLFVFDEHGDRVATSVEDLSRQNYADRDYFRYHQTNADDHLLVSMPVRGKGDGVWVITVTRRMSYPDGRFAGVVNVSLALDAFQRFYNKFDVGENGIITLTNGVGTIVVRRPFEDATVGQTMGRSQIFRDFVDTSESRSFEYTALLDGQIRLGSYQRVRGFDLVVIVGREKAEVLEVWWQEARTHFIWLVATLVVIVWLGLRLTRQIADRLQAERRLAAANDELVRINLTDALTGIANRRGFDQALLHEWSRASRSGTQMALLMIDVDSFKSFNDVYGHPEGDLCLQTIATVLEQAVRRPGDVTARYGGEEFSAILPDTDEHGAVVVATNIRETLARLAINHVGAAAGCVTVSIGIAVLAPSNDVSPTVLLKLADARLYQAKEEGRDRIVCSGDCKTEAHQLALTA